MKIFIKRNPIGSNGILFREEQNGGVKETRVFIPHWDAFGGWGIGGQRVRGRRVGEARSGIICIFSEILVGGWDEEIKSAKEPK